MYMQKKKLNTENEGQNTHNKFWGLWIQGCLYIYTCIFVIYTPAYNPKSIQIAYNELPYRQSWMKIMFMVV